jgi:hypothetical protein
MTWFDAALKSHRQVSIRCGDWALSRIWQIWACPSMRRRSIDLRFSDSTLLDGFHLREKVYFARVARLIV